MALNTFIDNVKKDGYIVTVYKNEEKRVFKVKVTSEKTGANIVQLIPFERCVGTQSSWEFLIRRTVCDILNDLKAGTDA